MIEIQQRTTKAEQFIDITQKVQAEIPEDFDGICMVYVPHTTAGLTINEHADPSVASDILSHLGKLVPKHDGFKHFEGNSDAHIKASIMGASSMVIVESGKLQLGTWQGIFFCEFDGPRNRKFQIKLLS